MDTKEKQIRNWKGISGFIITILLFVAIALLIIGIKKVDPPILKVLFSSKTQSQSVSGVKVNALDLWNDSADSKAALITYVESVTKEESPDFIPVENRVAVFDMDGTFLNETDPYYYDFCLLKYRVLDDPLYKDRASYFERSVAMDIKAYMEGDKSKEVSMTDHGKAVAMAFAGMTIDEFEDYIAEFKKQPMPGYNNMTRGDGFYKPMLQVIDYLQANGFKVYVVSGTDRFIVRGILKDSVNIPRNQIIGSDETLVATNQGSTDGLDYTFTDKDKVVLGGNFIIKNLKMNKVSSIVQEIGIQPVLSFGNSTGDSAMAEYTTTNNKYKSLAFMLCCDDLVRENGNEEKADQMEQLCRQYGWIPVSMKNDWKTIYGENVTRKQA
ncbi:MAG: haloacid dehalogenase-like hydrolase [Saccharofermentans sp.]|nr:haloacid dehalogenase-like hydrolase [Saccharofermentans sp.]